MKMLHLGTFRQKFARISAMLFATMSSTASYTWRGSSPSHGNPGKRSSFRGDATRPVPPHNRVQGPRQLLRTFTPLFPHRPPPNHVESSSRRGTKSPIFIGCCSTDTKWAYVYVYMFVSRVTRGTAHLRTRLQSTLHYSIS